MGTYKNVLYEKQRKGVLITLNRPEALNAISRELEDEIHLALDEAEADPEIRAIVLTGAGRAFSAGYDMGGGRGPTVWPYGLSEGTSVAETLDRARIQDKPDKFLHMWELTKPVIAAVNGWCMGGGSWYALFSHMTYASENAVFAQPEIRMVSNTSFIWVLNAGYKNALRYSLTGDHIAPHWDRQPGGSRNRPHRPLLQNCRADRPRLPRDGEDQLGSRNDGARNDGPSECTRPEW